MHRSENVSFSEIKMIKELNLILAKRTSINIAVAENCNLETLSFIFIYIFIFLHRFVKRNHQFYMKFVLFEKDSK